MSQDILIPPLLTLPEGLVGLPQIRELQVVPIAGGEFIELVASGHEGFGWLAASAEDVRPGMTAALRAGGRVENDTTLLVLLASHGSPAVVTANLAGPIAVDPEGTARQLVLEDPAYELRVRIGRLTPAAAQG